MSDYRIGIGHDLDLGDLTLLQPQPTSTGVQVTRRVVAANGMVHDQGLYVQLIWPVLEGDAEYRTILGYFGLNAAKVADVTIYARDERWLYRRYNGLAVQPELGTDARWRYFPTNITILVRNLKEVDS